MGLIKLQEKVPSTYIEQSRDFQLFLHTYDAIFNSVKYDIDSMETITDTLHCRNNILELLQTKLGYFSTKAMNNKALRYILATFPIMLRHKGSLAAVKEAVNVFLKIYNIESAVTIYYITNSEIKYNVEINDHTIVIGLNNAIKDISILEDVLRYLLPAGFGFYFYFFNSIEDSSVFLADESATLLYASDDIASLLKSTDSIDIYAETKGSELEHIPTINRVIAAVDTTEIISGTDELNRESSIFIESETSDYAK